MKAYIVSLKNDDSRGNEILFAENTKEAKKQALSCGLYSYADSYIDLIVRRYKQFDNMESFSDMELQKEMWRLGWWFVDMDDLPDCDKASDEDFFEWYRDKH